MAASGIHRLSAACAPQAAQDGCASKTTLDTVQPHVYFVGMADLLGTFEQIVLLAVLGLEREAYGRAVLREVQESSPKGRTISAGAVYATLDRLEGKGLLSSQLERGTPERGGLPRRFYSLTAVGVSALNDTRGALEKAWRGKRWPLEAMA